MGYYVSKGFFDTIPKSLDEAARVDGATRFQVFRKIRESEAHVATRLL